MYVQKRKDRRGVEYYSFSYLHENGRRVRLKKSQHPVFTDMESAVAWAKSQEAFRQSQKDRINKKLAWKTQYYDFTDLVEKFTKYQKKKAPNSWENCIYYLEHYALDWFLNKKKQNNINAWHFLFNEYRDWLADDAKTLTGGKLAYSSGNQAIHALNSFFAFMHEAGLIDPDSLKKCPAFPEHMLTSKSFDDVIDEQEFKTIHLKLMDIEEASADFWWVLYHTGMRFNEAFGLPMSALFAGKTTGTLHEELLQHKMDYVGYVVLESQSATKVRTREEDGTIKRKPLKGRRTIHPKNNRIIPIVDRTCWNILAKRHKIQKAKLAQKEWGSDPINYMMFEELAYSRLKRNLEKAYRESGYRAKVFHDCRHSYCTYLVGKTRSFFLARAVLGHKSNAFERYLHIYEQISLKAQQNVQEIEEIA